MEWTLLMVLHAVLVSLLFTSIAEVSEEEAEKLLKALNKPFVKSIQSNDGDVIDCVLLYKQPAFDNPLLKNHKIEMRPSSSKKSFAGILNTTSNAISRVWHTNESCPSGTIPIIRTKKETILKASSIESFGRKPRGSRIPGDGPKDANAYIYAGKHEYAVMELGNGPFYGMETSINVWAPYVQREDEFSNSQVWVLGHPSKGPSSTTVTVEAGWQVYHRVYGDDRPRFFTYWTADSYQKTGCYNLLCAAFVQTSGIIPVGAQIGRVSYSGSAHQFDITLRIFKGLKRWWLYFGPYEVGYWPFSLFAGFEMADRLQFGGEILNLKTDGKHTKTEMGSGVFAKEGFGKASFFRRLMVYDDNSGVLRDIVTKQKNRKFHLHGTAHCYDVAHPAFDTQDDHWRWNFYYGGPGYRRHHCE